MTKIRPFKAVRPTRDKVHLVASRSYVSYSPESLNDKLSENPYTFIHVINPEFGKQGPKKEGKARFYMVKSRFDEFVDEGVYVQDEIPQFYIYRQTKQGVNPNVSYTGIIAGASIDDYMEGHIKVHEQTLTKRENMFKDYLDVCDFNAEPVLLTYPPQDAIEEIVKKYTSQRAEYDFTSTNKDRHTVWLIDKDEDIKGIMESFENVSDLYIADGHHRSASSVLLGEDRRKNKGKFDGEESFNYFMSYLVPEDQLHIYDFNRLVEDLNHLYKDEFIEKLEQVADLTSMGSDIFKPTRLHQLSMYLEGEWFALEFKSDYYDDFDPINSLDAHLLSKHILGPILEIHDLKTDKRIEFMDGVKGMQGLKDRVDSERAKVAFGLFPVSIEQLKHVADTGNSMPPKSTYVEPKLRSGLTIFPIEK
ncbi:MAG: hypothetical protein ACI8ZO_001003 [Flavobacteriales bacterium]|jgi:uncharacterized protein (DUF1015 family)